MPIDKIKPNNDPRISLRSAILNGYTYGYLYSTPPKNITKRGTIFLIHGFPDLSFGWRYQIPLLTSLGLEVIALDTLGYGRSDAPGTHSISAYTYKRIADDIETLCKQLGISRIILGGHDWGGAIVYRVAQFKANLVQALFVVCTPFSAPQPTYTPLRLMVDSILPNFRYQLHFASGELETAIQSPREIRNFLNALYGARTSDRRSAFNAQGNVALDLLPAMGESKLLTTEEMDYYVTEYARHGINGPLNWYRSREAQFLDDLDFFYGGDPKKNPNGVRSLGIEQETLFVFATKDAALPEWMSRNMRERIPKLKKETVEASHWALWERPEEVNGMIERWIKEKVFGSDTGRGSKL